MPTNTYFAPNGNPQENRLVDDLWAESIQAYGYDLFYIPRTMVNTDKILGSDFMTKFVTEALPIEMYVDSVQGFGGDGDFMSKFGLEIRDTIDFTCSRSKFDEIITRRYPTIMRPMEGDLIYFPLSKGLFEIRFVEHENPFYQLNKLYAYKITCELFKYGQEKLSTGIPDVDALEQELSDISDQTKSPYAENATIETENTLQDFTETNPFGSY